QRGAAVAKGAAAAAAGAGAGERGDRADAGDGPASAAEAAAHGASDLDAIRKRAAGASDRGAGGAPIRTAAQTGTRSGRPDGMRAAELPLGAGGAGRLVRGDGEGGWRGAQTALVRDAQHGVRRRVPSGLYARYAASIAGSARVGVRLFRGRVPD